MLNEKYGFLEDYPHIFYSETNKYRVGVWIMSNDRFLELIDPSEYGTKINYLLENPDLLNMLYPKINNILNTVNNLFKTKSVKLYEGEYDDIYWFNEEGDHW